MQGTDLREKNDMRPEHDEDPAADSKERRRNETYDQPVECRDVRTVNESVYVIAGPYEMHSLAAAYVAGQALDEKPVVVGRGRCIRKCTRDCCYQGEHDLFQGHFEVERRDEVVDQDMAADVCYGDVAQKQQE